MCQRVRCTDFFFSNRCPPGDHLLIFLRGAVALAELSETLLKVFDGGLLLVLTHWLVLHATSWFSGAAVMASANLFLEDLDDVAVSKLVL